MLTFDHVLCDSGISCIDCINDLIVFLDSKLYLHQNVDYLFSHAAKLLDLIRTITFSFFIRLLLVALHQPNRKET